MPVEELEPVPEYICGGKYRPIGGFAVCRGTKLAGCGRDVPDARKIAEALGIDEPLIIPVDRGEPTIYGCMVA